MHLAVSLTQTLQGHRLRVFWKQKKLVKKAMDLKKSLVFI